MAGGPITHERVGYSVFFRLIPFWGRGRTLTPAMSFPCFWACRPASTILRRHMFFLFCLNSSTVPFLCGFRSKISGTGPRVLPPAGPFFSFFIFFPPTLPNCVFSTFFCLSPPPLHCGCYSYWPLSFFLPFNGPWCSSLDLYGWNWVSPPIAFVPIHP